VTVGLLSGGVADAAKKKKKKKAGGTVSVTKSVNQAIPDQLGVAPFTWGKVTSTIDISGKKFKGKVVGDVNLMVQTTGDVADAANDLVFRLTAPNGRTIVPIAAIGDQSIGPFTMDDDTPVLICDSITPPCPDPDRTLNQPFAGTAQPTGPEFATGPIFAGLNGVPMRGSWTLKVFDEDAGQTSTFNQWALTVTSAKPVK